ncbi:helix-turn-helix domain-containing protein [Moritella dasanensis]|uniref:helix-turn-helix domain-containing protein n=1 Tax=Moritella dasanensis TaxID=428031 RepID=UPI0002F2E8F2|nr:helix-turn-helix domain-containing protein [Moritella dasanensis]
MQKENQKQVNRFTRIEKLLDFINENIDQPLSVEILADKSCWSRWQLQRVFHLETGLNLAQYVRELKLSLAAERLLGSKHRVVDIALALGFSSEVSFSRTFKNMFSHSPIAYRRRGQRLGLRTPIKLCSRVLDSFDLAARLLQIRIETRPEFTLHCTSGVISGLFSLTPNYQQQVPLIWSEFVDNLPKAEMLSLLDGSSSKADNIELIGVVGVIQAKDDIDAIPYWAGCTADSLCGSTSLDTITVPAQEYAVIPFTGPIKQLEQVLAWLFSHWLPDSDYDSIDGYELEIYPANYDPEDATSYMEYWLPIEPRR